MKVIPIALRNDFAANSQTLAKCLTITPEVGPVIRATGHDQNLVIDGMVYYAAAGGTSTDVASTAALNVDNAEHQGMYNLDYISEADLRAGIYDNAIVETFIVNYEALDHGRYDQGWWTTGTVTMDRATFIAQLRGVMQALQQPFGLNILPTCYKILGDAQCRRSLVDLTVTGTLDSVSFDQLTLYDAARTEPGPSGAISIIAISLANPPVVTLNSAIAQANGTAVVFSAINGPVRLNGVWTIQNKSTNSLTFEINTDTTNDVAYVGSGLVTPIVADAGWFGYGLITITSGPNAGIPREVKLYVTGQIMLHDRFPYALAGGEGYSMIAGCDKTGPTCLTKFANKVNFGGFEFVPGQDSAFQVGVPG